MKSISLLIFSLLLSFIAHSQIDFQGHVIIDNTLTTLDPYAVFAADLDGDGDNDMLSASSEDNKIAWYENLDGLGNFSLTKVISTEVEGARDVAAADLDGDGDMDVLAAARRGNYVVWYENLDGKGDFGPLQVIGTNLSQVQDLSTVDLDGDGDLDVISAGSSGLAWFENTDGQGGFSNPKIVSNSPGRATVAYTGDIDNDGDIDLLGASFFSGKVFWFENITGLGHFGPSKTISSNTTNSIYNICLSDLDGDGDLDVISGSSTDEKVVWQENTDGLGSFGPQKTLGLSLRLIRSVSSSDIDGDGDMDVIYSASNASGFLAWFENMDGLGSFSAKKTISSTGQLRGIYVADLDGDDDLDVMSASGTGDKVGWFPNLNGLGSFGTQQLVSDYGVLRPTVVISADLDGDGDKDVISASAEDNKIAWYENKDGMGGFGSQQEITTSANYVLNVSANDLDGDGDIDLLSATYGGGNVAWYENTDGLGSFSSKKIISADMPSSFDAFAIDLDLDGDLDVLTHSWTSHKIAWFENLDGQGNFGSERLIPNNQYLVGSIDIADLDEDGDIDILASVTNDFKLVWYENIDGLGTFESEKMISDSTEISGSTKIGDIDNDGDMDIITALWSEDKIVWHENTGQGNFSSQQIIATDIISPSHLHLKDIDRDDDLDIFCTSDDNNLTWFENVDGQGDFGAKWIINDQLLSASSIYSDDLDGDGDLDILTSSREEHKIAWYENQSIIVVGSNEIINPKGRLLIYPNPVEDIINIQLLEESIASVTLYTLTGQKIKTSFSSELSLAHLAAGAYLLEVRSTSGKSEIKKLIKK